MAGGINPFAYVANNPVAYSDPSGLCPQNTGLQFLRDPSGGSYGPGKEDLIRAIVNGMLSEACTNAFKAAGLTSPAELLKKGVVIGPASLLLDSSGENLQYMGITAFARNRDANNATSGGTAAVTIRDHPGKTADTTMEDHEYF